MKRSSKMILAVAAACIAVLVVSMVQVSRTSRPELSEADARAMLTRLKTAFEGEKVESVLSFAFPDCKVAGRDLKRIRALLHQGFRSMTQPQVNFDQMTYLRQGDTARVRFTVTVKDLKGDPQIYGPTGMGFVVKRRAVPQFLGLFSTYEWKITDVDAINLPEELRM